VLFEPLLTPLTTFRLQRFISNSARTTIPSTILW
jgi:hypothetical protein